MHSELRAMTKALRAINEAGEAGHPVILPATPRGARYLDILNHPDWSWEEDWDSYVGDYHSEDDDGDRDCANCGEYYYDCDCGDYEPEPASLVGRRYLYYPRGWATPRRTTPVGHAHVGAELEVTARVLDSEWGGGPVARVMHDTVGAAQQMTGLSFNLEEDSSLPDGGFEIISGYGLWPAVARGWCHVLDSVDTHRLIRGVDPSLSPFEKDQNELENLLHQRGATVWNWPGGEGIIPKDELASDTYERVYVAAPEWMGKYAEAAAISRKGWGAPNRRERRVRDVKDRADSCGMHVHVSPHPESTVGISRDRIAKRCEQVMVDFLKTDTLGYLFVVGRLPDDNFCVVGGSGRYSLVAERRHTVEFRGFASTLNPRMFAARVELALVVHYMVLNMWRDVVTWEDVRQYVMSGEAGVENLRTVLMMLPAFTASCAQQMSLPFIEEGCVTDPAVPGNTKESENMDINVTLNNPTIHVHMAGADGEPVVGLASGNLVGDLVDAMHTAAAEAATSSPDDLARLAYGTEGTNAAKAKWSIGKFVNDGERDLFDDYDSEDTVGKVIGVLFRNGDLEGENSSRANYRSLYRAAGGYAKLGSREFYSSDDVFELADSRSRDFIGVAAIVEV